MTRKEFDEIYVNYGERRYPAETTQSVQACHFTYEKKEQAITDAKELRRISKKAAMEDVIHFFNCLKRCYCGYDYFLTDELCEKIQKQLSLKIKLWPRKISNRRLWYFLYQALHNKISDSHFELHVAGRSLFFRKNHIAYVADIVLCKSNDSYEVVNDNADFEKGYVFEKNQVQEYLMPTLYLGADSRIDESYYLLGKYSETEVKEFLLAGKKVKTHRILCDLATQDGEERIVPKDGYVLVNHKSYGMPWEEALLAEYYKDGVSCAGSDAVILNLTGNGGGCSDYPSNFYEGLNGSGENGFLGAHLPAPSELCDEGKKYEFFYPDSEIPATYQGDLYVVMNHAVASSAEMGVSPSFYVKNAVRVGSGSLGCASFGECVTFQLPNSKIIFCFGHKLFYHERFEECKGFLPDFWIDDKEPVRVVEEYIKRKKETKYEHSTFNH